MICCPAHAHTPGAIRGTSARDLVGGAVRPHSPISRHLCRKRCVEYGARSSQAIRGPREPFAVPNLYPPIIDNGLLNRVQAKLKSEIENVHNAFAHRTQYLLCRLVVCDLCGHHFVGTNAKSGRFAYYLCITRVQRGCAACNASVLKKETLEKRC
jgi:hypothetical protein